MFCIAAGGARAIKDEEHRRRWRGRVGVVRVVHSQLSSNPNCRSLPSCRSPFPLPRLALCSLPPSSWLPSPVGYHLNDGLEALSSTSGPIQLVACTPPARQRTSPALNSNLQPEIFTLSPLSISPPRRCSLRPTSSSSTPACLASRAHPDATAATHRTAVNHAFIVNQPQHRRARRPPHNRPTPQPSLTNTVSHETVSG